MKTHSIPLDRKSIRPILRERAWLLFRTISAAAVVGCGVSRAVGADYVVHIHDNFFSPKQLAVAPSDSVQWVNDGNNQHTTTSNTGLWDSGILNHGDTFSLTFSNLGNFPYFCQVHGQSMSGTINVTTNGGSAVSNLFLVNVSGSFRTTNALGKVVVTPEKSKDLVADCASDHQLNPADLSLVYDLEADTIKAVQSSSGSTVCALITFAGGTSVTAADGLRTERQAFVFWEDSQEANGSVAGTELSTRGLHGELLKFSFRGSIQFGLEMYEGEPPKVFQGTFTTGRMFVPQL
jgi:plastocyanin